MQNQKAIWERFYKKISLSEIPWQQTQAGWFKSLVDKGVIQGKSALDLGCGTGMKSLYLSEKGGFKKVVGVDISPAAIAYARKNAQKHRIDEKCKFYERDATDLSFLKNQKFDFVLDWAMLHGLLPQERKKYISEIVKHTSKGALLLLRIFGKQKERNIEYFENEVDSQRFRVYLFSRNDILRLYGKHFEIVDENMSKPRTHKGLYFGEYLMKRK